MPRKPQRPVIRESLIPDTILTNPDLVERMAQLDALPKQAAAAKYEILYRLLDEEGGAGTPGAIAAVARRTGYTTETLAKWFERHNPPPPDVTRSA